MIVRWSAAVLMAWAVTASAYGQSVETNTTIERKPADTAEGPPSVTAKAWAIADRSGKFLWGAQEDEPRYIASTSKIMTAWVVLQLAEKNAAVLDERVTFSKRADETGGSTAGVRAGESLSTRVLLYGLMLPSGNDASVALAEHFGDRFIAPSEKASGDSTAKDNHEAFIAEMNRVAKNLGMKNTTYVDPHGLGANQASARDLLRLAHAAMQNATFRHYVSTREYTATVEGEAGNKRELKWNNTNRLLRSKGYDGVKTGTTSRAGACLVSSGRRDDDRLLMVVLGATSSDARYTDSRSLYRWAWSKRGHRPAEAAAGEE